jgi:hypothetical protein
MYTSVESIHSGEYQNRQPVFFSHALLKRVKDLEIEYFIRRDHYSHRPQITRCYTSGKFGLSKILLKIKKDKCIHLVLAITQSAYFLFFIYLEKKNEKSRF